MDICQYWPFIPQAARLCYPTAQQVAKVSRTVSRGFSVNLPFPFRKTTAELRNLEECFFLSFSRKGNSAKFLLQNYLIFDRL